MDRRHFLRSAATALAAPGLIGGLDACSPGRPKLTPGTVQSAGGRRLARLGLQLYTLRDAARRDLDRTLSEIAAIGYREVELLDAFNGNFGHPAEELRPMLDRRGLHAPSTHIAGTALLRDLDRTLDDAAFLGHSYLIVASLGDEEARTLDDYRRWADRLNEAGAAARKRDLWIGFHNHAGDFRTENGTVLYDALIERTDPAITRHQLDTGNLADAGRDPLDYLRRYGERYWLFHVKDHAKPPAKGDGDLGTGTLDFRKILAAIPRLDEKHLFVEQETYPLGDPLTAARRDYQYMMALEF